MQLVDSRRLLASLLLAASLAVLAAALIVTAQPHDTIDDHNSSPANRGPRVLSGSNNWTTSNGRRGAAAAKHRAAVKEATGGLVRLCLDNGPDGMALLADTETNQQVLLVFKTKSYWPTSIEAIREFSLVNNRSAADVFSEFNEYDLTKWERFPTSPQLVVSFNALPKENQFFNNVLAFKDNALYRYRVTKLTFSIQNKRSIFFDIKTELVAEHSSRLWHHMGGSVANVGLAFIPRETRALVFSMRDSNIIYWRQSVYLLNEANMETPIEYHVKLLPMRYLDRYSDWFQIRYLYELGQNDDLIFYKDDGYLCFNDRCRPMRHAVDCPDPIGTFTSGFVFWIWTNTNLTLRLLSVGLSSIMVVNFILASAFVYNQVKRVLDLT